MAATLCQTRIPRPGTHREDKSPKLKKKQKFKRAKNNLLFSLNFEKMIATDRLKFVEIIDFLDPISVLHITFQRKMIKFCIKAHIKALFSAV